MSDDRHHQSTQALRALLRHGLALLDGNSSRPSHYRIGPMSFSISSNSGPLLQNLTRCLVPGGSGGDLTIGILSGSHAPFEAPPSWNLPHTHVRHLERLHADGSFTAFFNSDFGQWLMLDFEERRGLMWIGDEALVPPWEHGSPFKTAINWFVAPTLFLMVHAGAVGTEMAGCLLVGQGGSGKSTTVAACFERGMSVCGDDLILVEERATDYLCWSLYDSVKLDPASAIGFPGVLAEAPFTMCAAKRLVRYTDAHPSGFVRSMPLKAALRCKIANKPRSSIIAESPAALLKSLVPPTVFLLRGREDDALPKLSRLVRRLPCFRLELGSDPAEAAACLQAWLEAGGEAAGAA